MALKVYHRDASPTELHILICKMADIRPVSYTHLTLPTISSV